MFNSCVLMLDLDIHYLEGDYILHESLHSTVLACVSSFSDSGRQFGYYPELSNLQTLKQHKFQAPGRPCNLIEHGAAKYVFMDHSCGTTSM